MKTRYLEKHDVPAMLRSGYNGQKFQLVIGETMQPNGMQWSGGSRNTYLAINLSTGQQRPIADPRPYPDNQSGVPTITIPSGWVIRGHVMFQGKDLGLRFYVHPDNVAALLPAQNAESLTHAQMVVLAATGRYKASYGGRKPRIEAAAEHGVDLETFEAAKASLIETGHLRKNGSITPKGRNVDTTEIRMF